MLQDERDRREDAIKDMLKDQRFKRSLEETGEELHMENTFVKHANKYWDKFYKRNGERFFKVRVEGGSFGVDDYHPNFDYNSSSDYFSFNILPTLTLHTYTHSHTHKHSSPQGSSLPVSGVSSTRPLLLLTLHAP